MQKSEDSKTQQGRRRFEVPSTEENLAKEEIEELQKEILKSDPTEFVPANIRNVLFCGASRSGKSTIFHVLQNSCYCPEKVTMFCETKFTSFKTFALRDKVDGRVHNFIVNLIDTPGTFELRSTKEEFETRSNDQIRDLIIECIQHEVTYLNLLVLVINASKFSPTELDSVDIFLKLFGEARIPIILCLTHADNIGAATRDHILEEMKIHPRLAKYVEKDIFKICFMGCVNYRQKDYTSRKVMDNDYKLVANWRDILIEHIFNAEKRVSLEETDIYLSRKKKCLELLETVQADLQYFSNKDISTLTGSEHLKLLDHKEKMNYLYQHSFYIDKERDEGNLALFQAFLNAVSEVKRSGDEKKLENILGQWY